MKIFQEKYDILSASRCGIEFEFYSEMSMRETARSISKALGKKVIVPTKVKGLGEKDKGNYHSDFVPTPISFKLERDYSGGPDMFELITGPMNYDEARIILIKMNKWISEKGWTNSKCALQFNISFNPFKIKLKETLPNLNVLKFVLGFDEDFVWSRFPERKGSVYAKSIFNIYPINRFIFFDKPENIDRTNYHVPNAKYFGVNFTKLPHDYLEFRYLGGQGYEKKTSKALECLDFFILRVYNTLQNNDTYTENEKHRLYKILAEQKKAVLAFNDPISFLRSYPNIFISVDLNGNVEILKAYWTTLREKLFSLVVDSGLKKGYFNLDTDISVYQLKEGEMKKANDVTGVELFDCVLSGSFIECKMFNCQVSSSRILNSIIVENTKISDSKIESTTINHGNTLKNCYINNPNEIVDCEVIGGVLRRGIVGENAKISSETLIVSSKNYRGKDK